MYLDQTSENKLQPIGSTVSGNFPQGHTGLGGLEAQAPKSATERETEQLHKAVSQLQQLVSSIQGRLKPVLTDSYPETVEDGRAEESIPALANAIRQSRYVAENTITIANNILVRLDI